MLKYKNGRLLYRILIKNQIKYYWLRCFLQSNKKVDKFQLCLKAAASLFPFSCMTFLIYNSWPKLKQTLAKDAPRHRHLRRIDWVIARTACHVCHISTISGRSKKAKNALGRYGASSGHITKLEQSIFFRYQCYNKTLRIRNL